MDSFSLNFRIICYLGSRIPRYQKGKEKKHRQTHMEREQVLNQSWVLILALPLSSSVTLARYLWAWLSSASAVKWDKHLSQKVGGNCSITYIKVRGPDHTHSRHSDPPFFFFSRRAGHNRGTRAGWLPDVEMMRRSAKMENGEGGTGQEKGPLRTQGQNLFHKRAEVSSARGHMVAADWHWSAMLTGWQDRI